MNRLWLAARAGFFLLDPETAHEASLRALEAGIYPRPCKPDSARLGQTLFGLNFPNPIGVAAGYDKDARAYNALFAMGFGFVEAGTVTPKPQPGNPRPRVFRLVPEQAIVNRMGFNNAGHAAAQLRLAGRPPKGILGINIGANRKPRTLSRTTWPACMPLGPSPPISPSTSPRQTRRACATCRRRSGSMRCLKP